MQPNQREPLLIKGTTAVDCFKQGSIGCYYFTNGERHLHYKTKTDCFQKYKIQAKKSWVDLCQYSEPSFYSKDEYDFFVSPEEDLCGLVGKMKLLDATMFSTDSLHGNFGSGTLNMGLTLKKTLCQAHLFWMVPPMLLRWVCFKI